MTRLEKLQSVLKKKNLDALLVSSAYNIGYLTGFFGFSKTEQEGYLLVTQNHLYFFASGLNSEAVRKHLTSGWTLITISPRSPLAKKALTAIIRKDKIKRLGFEKNNLTYIEYEYLNDLNHLNKIIPTENLVENLRMVKEPGEIEAIEKACELGDKTFEYVLKKIRYGVSEKDLATKIEFFVKRHGADISFPPIVAFGANSSVPHHQSTNNSKLITPNQTVLFDFGVKVDNYCSDMTRTVFFGKANRKQKRIYKTVLEAQKKAIEHLGRWRSNDFDSSEVDKVARDYIISKGFPTIPHSLGHGIGLEVHELPRLSPRSRDKLKPGMVFSLEPGIYLPGFGGVRIEDLVLLTEQGLKLLTKSPKHLIEI